MGLLIRRNFKEWFYEKNKKKVYFDFIVDIIIDYDGNDCSFARISSTNEDLI